MKFDWKQSIESMTVAMVLVFILLPIRLFFVSYVSNNWLGSFGVITTISVLIIYLAKKNKLGWFGRAFHRQMFKIHHGKRRYFVYTQLILGTIFFSMTVHAIHIGDELFELEKNEIIDQLEFKNMNELMAQFEKDIESQKITAKEWVKAFYVLFYIVIFRFDLFAIIMSSMNELMEGWPMHFATVFLVEEIELIGIAILSRFTIKSEKPTES